MANKKRSTPPETIKKVSRPRKAVATNEPTNYAPLAIILGLILVAVLAALFGASVATSNGATTVEPTAFPTAEVAATCNAECEAPPVVEEVDACFYTAWHNGWENGPWRISTTGVLNRTELEEGMSMQASWDKWTKTTSVGGYIVPKMFEVNNDAVMVIVCGDTVYMLDRNGSAPLPFWAASHFELTDSGLVVSEHDTGTPGTWEGDGAGTQVLVKGVHLNNITVPGDLQENWDSLMNLMQTWDGTVPTQGNITDAWIPAE